MEDSTLFNKFRLFVLFAKTGYERPFIGVIFGEIRDC